MLKAPVIGNINCIQASSEFASTMSTLLGAGFGVSDALLTTSKVVSNKVISNEIKNMAEQVVIGNELGKIMQMNKHFPQVLKEMTAVGEKTGELEATLETVSDYYTTEYDYEVSKLIGKLEPTMMIFLAIFAGFIVIALYLPMFSMYDLM